MKPQLRVTIINLALFFENYILPILFAGSIYYLLVFFVKKHEILALVIGEILKGHWDRQGLILVSLAVSKFFFIILYSLFLYGMLVHRPVEKKPESYQELIFPLLGTFFYLFYQISSFIPPEYNFYIIPEEWLLPSLITGVMINIVGFVIAIKATFDLRHSFAIFVETRGLVVKGLYSWVRHPLYLGHILVNVGTCFILPKLFYLFLTVLVSLITIYRAVMEERKIVSVHPEYKGHMARTPFIFPWGKRFKD